jgi:hypothetical protein
LRRLHGFDAVSIVLVLQLLGDCFHGACGTSLAVMLVAGSLLADLHALQAPQPLLAGHDGGIV